MNKRYTKKYALKELTWLGKVTLFLGAQTLYFNGNWRVYPRLWHPIGLVCTLLEVLINVLLYGATSIYWHDYIAPKQREGEQRLSFWSAPWDVKS